ncbi:MAG: hypothetical protein WDZ80_04240 [Candidatus Paceibacterota bacterium]
MNKQSLIEPFIVTNILFFLLFIGISYFLYQLLNRIDEEVVLHFVTKTMIILCAFLGMGIVITIAKTIVLNPNKDESDNLAQGFIMAGLLFRLTILLFFVTIYFWTISLGGALESPFVSLMTVSPVFFAFSSPTNFDKLFGNDTMVNRKYYKIHIAEMIIRFIIYLVFMATVFSFDFNLFSISYDNIQLTLFDYCLTYLKEYDIYKTMHALIFLGSVIAIVLPPLANKYMPSKESYNVSNQSI